MDGPDGRCVALSIMREYLRECAQARRRGESGQIEFGKFLGARLMAYAAQLISFDDFCAVGRRGSRLALARAWRAQSPAALHTVH